MIVRDTIMATLEEGEEVLFAVRKHLIVYFIDGCVYVFGVGIILFLSFFLLSRGGAIGEYLSFFCMALILISFTAYFYSWTKIYFDVWYVTNRHVIAIDQKDILQREESFMEFRRIQDVFFEKNGLLQTIFGSGTLKVQTAGTEQEFVIHSVRNVEEMAHQLMKLRDESFEKEKAIVSAV